MWEDVGQCQKSGRIVPLNDLVKDGLTGLLVYKDYYNPPRPKIRPPKEEDYSNPSPARYIRNIIVKFPAWDAELRKFQAGQSCVCSVGVVGFA